MTKPTASTAVAEQVAATLRDRIVKGELAPFDRIVERRLSAELNVSRTPIREALKLLEADGLIEITLHRGAIVSEYRPEEAFLLFDVIAMLEGLAARAASVAPGSKLRVPSERRTHTQRPTFAIERGGAELPF